MLAKGSFLQTVQLFVYGGTGSLIFRGIPIIGLVYSFIYLGNVVRGAQRVHKISLVNAILALVAIPIILVIAVSLFA